MTVSVPNHRKAMQRLQFAMQKQGITLLNQTVGKAGQYRAFRNLLEHGPFEGAATGSAPPRGE